MLVNARAAVRPELGGVERFARELVARLPALAPERYRTVRPPPALVHRAGHAWEQAVLPMRAWRARAALLVNPANVAPVAFPRNLVVVHDVTALAHPEWYAPAYVAWQRALLPRIVRRALHLVTVSEFARGEIVDRLGADPARTSVVPGGVGEAFTPQADPAPAARALGLDGPYVLALGNRTARKNLAALGPAARALAVEGIAVVAAGGDRPQFRPEPPVPGVREIGRVPEPLLPGLYAGARAFVLPSRHEGFGLTCLEAMAAGVPVVAAAAAALPETCGDAALLVDPEDRAALAAAVLRAVGDGAERARLIAAGAARARAFSWARTARELDAVVRGLLT